MCILCLNYNFVFPFFFKQQRVFLYMDIVGEETIQIENRCFFCLRVFNENIKANYFIILTVRGPSPSPLTNNVKKLA